MKYVSLQLVHLALFFSSIAYSQIMIDSIQPIEFGSVSSKTGTDFGMQIIYDWPIDANHAGSNIEKDFHRIDKILKPILDSIYYWDFDQNSNSLALSGKNSNFVYDEDYDLLEDEYLRMVSGQWQNTSKEQIAYDDNKREISRQAYDWQGSWTPLLRTLHSYTAFDSLSLLLREFWQNEQWDLAYRFEYSYNENRLRASVVTEGSGGKQRQIYTYDASDQLLSTMVQRWINEEWVNFDIAINGYDENGLVINSLIQSWNGTNWVNDTQTIHTYNEEQQMVSSTEQEWDGFDWQNTERHLMEYDENGNELLLTFQYWIDNWTNQSRTTYGYSTEGLLSFIQRDNCEDQWIGIDQKFYTFYDEGDLLESILEKYWDGIEWVNTSKQEGEYDENGNESNVYTYQWWNEVWNLTNLQSFTYNEYNFLTDRSVIDYDVQTHLITDFDSLHVYMRMLDVISSTSKDSASDLTIYPNPSTGKFRIQSLTPIESIEIYDPQGKVVYGNSNVSETISPLIDLSEQTKGIYLLKIRRDGEYFIRRVVVGKG